MNNDSANTLGFPFRVDNAGAISASGGDEAIRGRIIQVLFTAPGERVHQPDFGCGLLNLVFEPNDSVLGPATEFTIGQALARWLSDVLVAENIQVSNRDQFTEVEIVYTRKRDLRQQAVRIQFK